MSRLKHTLGCRTRAIPEYCVWRGAKTGAGSAVVSMDFAGGRHSMQAVPE